MIDGLAAAILWGVADFSAALLSRRLRAVPTVFLVQGWGVVGAVVLWSVLRPTWDVPLREFLLLVCNGALAGAAYVVLYRALAVGPVALVSPIAATYAVVSVGLSITVLGESLTSAMLAAAGVTLLGVVLASTDPSRLRGGLTADRTGIRLALAAALLFGVATFILGRAAQEIGTPTAVLLGRSFTFLAIGVALARTPERLAGVDRRGIAAAAGLGMIDLLGILSYSRGTERGLISLVTAASATFPLVSVIGGMVLLGERPARIQLVGALIVVVGLVGLGLVS